MDSTTRKNNILKILNQASGPVSATALAKELGVSRQIIVGDVALLRASGCDINATPRGYIIASAATSNRTRIVCQHTDTDTKKELTVMVDNGCHVIDVIVEHPVYGQLTGLLNIASRYDIKVFLQKVASSDAHSLCELTDGIHIHTIEYPDKDSLERTILELKEAGFIYE